jgi:hypothetical protein
LLQNSLKVLSRSDSVMLMRSAGRAMMGRSSRDQGQLFYSFNLEEVVPDDHLVRAIAGILDLSWVGAEDYPHGPSLPGILEIAWPDYDPHPQRSASSEPPQIAQNHNARVTRIR